MAYADPNTVHNPSTGTVPPASWGDVIRDDLEFLVDPPVCSVYNSSSVSHTTSGTYQVLNANSELYDNDGMHSTSTNTSRITAITAGRYLFIATVLFAANSTGGRMVRFSHNGTTAIQGMKVRAVDTGSETTVVTATRSYVMAANDYMEVQANQTSGGALNVTLDEFQAVFLTR